MNEPIDELELACKLIPVSVRFVYTDEGIRVVVVDKPQLYKDVKIASYVIAEVRDWLNSPRLCEKEQWERIRIPLFEVVFAALGLASQCDDLPKELLYATLEEMMRQREKKGRAGGECHDSC